MDFTPTYDNLSERAPWLNLYYNTLIDNIQAKKIGPADLTDPFSFSDHVGFGNNRIYAISHGFGISDTDDSCIRYATGFGAGNNSAAIQSAIDSLPVTGGIVICPPGVWDITESVSLNGTSDDKNNVMVAGFGEATEFKANAGIVSGTPMVQYRHTSGTPSGCVLRDVYINGNNDASTGVLMRETTDCWLINVKIYTMTNTLNDSCIEIRNTTDCHIHHCNANDAYYILYQGSDAGSNLDIFNCKFSNATQNGIDFEISPATVWIRKCKINSNGNNGIQFDSASGSPLQDLYVVDCDISDNTNSGVLFSTGGTNTYHTNLGVYNSRIYSNNANGIKFDAGSVFETNTFLGVRAIGNHVEVNGTSGSKGHGIFLSGAIWGGSIANNFAIGNGDDTSSYGGIYAQGGSGGALDEVTAVSFTGNTCLDDTSLGGNGQYFGLWLNVQTRNCVIMSNVGIGDAAEYGVRDNGTGNIYETAALDPYNKST